MSRLKSGALVLLLMIPFGLYIAWQVQSAARADLAAPEPPSEKALPGLEQVAASRAKTEKWLSNARRTSTVALQYRAGEAVDDPACAAVVKSVAARSADLTDLEKFVADDKGATFTGSLKKEFAEWMRGRANLAAAANAIDTWLRSPFSPPVDSPPRAAEALKAFGLLIEDYQQDRKFANLSKVAGWWIEARVKIIDALDEAATKPYDEALNLPLSGFKGNKLVEKAVVLPAAIREQVKLLQRDLQEAETAKRTIPDSVKKAADTTIRSAREWQTREQLLALFADPELFGDPNKATDWLPRLHEQYLRTQTKEARDLIKKKTQQFCDGYIPAAVALDTKVLWKGNPVPRADVRVGGPNPAKGGKLEDEPLSATHTGTNEFNAAERYPGVGGYGVYKGEYGTIGDLLPTPISKAAWEYTAARLAVVGGTGGPKWTVKSIEELKNKCGKFGPAVNQVKGSDLKSESLRLTDRLTLLLEGAEKCRSLFE